MTRTFRPARTAIGLALAAAAVALPVAGAGAQTRADGQYPAVLLCDPLPGGGALRDSFTLSVADGRASYARRLSAADGPGAAGANETGSGTVSGGRVTLVGRARGRAALYEAHFAGELTGQGGLLTGRQQWTLPGGRTASRACQLTVGNGRG